MSTRKFIKRLLKLKGLTVKNFKFMNWYNELWLEVKPHKNGCMCPLLPKALQDRQYPGKTESLA